jgi:hypothetical protein
MRIILTEAHVDNKSLLRILTQDKQINKADPNYSQYVKLADWANVNQQKIKNIDLGAADLSDRSLIKNGKLASKFATLGHLLLALKNLMDQQGKYDQNNDISKLVQQLTSEALIYLKEGPKLYQGMDWTAENAKRLSKADGNTSEVLDKFYNDYYKIEYAGLKSPNEEDASGIVDKLKSLDKILIQEFNKLGYNPAVNPLAQFLKILIEKRPKIFNKLNINTYGAIHNSFIDRALTGNMLGNYNENHILFCDDLYNYKGLDMVKYLKLYSDTLKRAENATIEPRHDKWVLAAKIFIQQNLSSPDVTSKVKFTDKVSALLNKHGVLIPTADEAKLRSFSEIEELYTYIFKTSPSTENAKENKILKEIITSAKSKNAMLDMIYSIASSKSFQKAHKEAVAKVVTELKNRRYRQNSELINYSRQVLALHEKEINEKDLLDIIKALFKAYDASKKKANK